MKALKRFFLITHLVLLLTLWVILSWWHYCFGNEAFIDSNTAWPARRIPTLVRKINAIK